VTITWSSSDTTILKVSQTGELTSRAVGVALITAAAGSKQATLPFEVFPPVATIEVLPQELGLVPSGVAEIRFVLKDVAGQELLARPLTLTSTNPGVATAAQRVGQLTVHAAAVGTSTLTIMREGKSAQIQVTVTQVQFDTVDASGGRGCGLTSDGAAWCWGTNATGALGYGMVGSGAERSGWTPIRVTGGHAFTQISLGNSHTCALTADGTAYCWGNNAIGALGVPEPSFSAVPVAVSGGLRFSRISASYAYTCGVTITGAAYCWGNNDIGQLGDGTKTERFVPVPVLGGLTFAQISSRFAEQFGATTCGLTVAGEAYCWGGNFQGQTGNGGPEVEYLTPIAVAGGHTFVELSAGGAHSCGIDGTGDAYCWGGGEPTDIPTIVPGGLNWRSISVLAGHTCGVITSDAAYCWGDNTSGQLGNGTTNDSGINPVPVAGGLAFQSISAALGYTCGRTLPGEVYCWGAGSSGNLGQNELEDHSTPVRVLGQP
jgi:alpha-tubulin suppressor-like RCC1 family protein